MIEKIKKKLRPTKAEEKKVKRVAEELIDKISKLVDAEVVLAGSIAKGTWVSKSHDIDIFVLFDKNVEEIDKKLISSLKKAFKFEVVHGSRDYAKFKYKGFDVEVIPLYKLSSAEEAENSIDASQFHIDYIRKHINEKLADEIRVFKQFLKANGVYGAETHISGFSGYVAELLILYFGSFKNFLKFIDEGVNPPIFIDIEKHYDSVESAIRTLGEHKTNSPIILIDPTNKYRNAAASLSYSTFAKFVFAARMFLRNPSEKFFKEKKVTIKEIEKLSKKRGTYLIKKKFKVIGNEEIFYAKLKRKIQMIKSAIEREGISVYSYGIAENYIYFEIETLKLSKMKKHFGPPVWVPKKHFDKFVKEWKKVYIDGTRIATDVSRDEVKTTVRRIIEDAWNKD